VSSTILAKQCGIGNYEWLQLNRQHNKQAQTEPQYFVGDAERLQEQGIEGADIILLADAETVVFKTVGFEDSERKLLRQTLPYTLEDDCIDDVDSLHFALGTVVENTVPIAIIKREQIEQQLHDAAEQGLELQQIVSELSFIPWYEHSWSLVVEDETWLVRTGEYQGFRLDVATASLSLQLLLDESDQLPERLRVFCPEERHVEVLNQLPELLRGMVEWHDDSYWQVLAQGLSEQVMQPKVINLLQGSYARSLPWFKWWKLWKMALILLAAVMITQIVASYAELKILESRNIDLRAQIERSYRSVVPRGAVMDPEKQLQRKVSEMKGAGGDGFVVLLQQIAPVLAAVDGLIIQSLNYTEKQSEIRLTVLANGFADVETARANLEKLGLKAELGGSSADGSKTRARLRIRGN